MTIKFDPERDPNIDAVKWKPNAHLTGLALRRCGWVNCDAINNLEPEEWIRAIIVGAYYQGIADIVRHNSRKSREIERAKGASE